MPLLTLPEPTQLVRRWDERSLSGFEHAQGPVGESLRSAAHHALAAWHSHSQYLARAHSGETSQRLSDAEFFGLLREMTNGPRPRRVTGTFSREELYSDNE